MTMPNTRTVVAAALLCASFAATTHAAADEPYNPTISPTDFSTTINNPYFSLPVGKKFVYEGKTKEGVERIEIEITGEKRTIMGVETLVYWDRVWVGEELVEDTKDYLAQDKAGNVRYFGEAVSNYENGKITDHDGSWIAGEKGALPGIWMQASNTVGDEFREEYYKGEAEDMGKVVAVGEAVKIAAGNYTNCVKIFDWTPLDKESKEHKTYCAEAGGLVLSEHLVKGERAELIKVENPG